MILIIHAEESLSWHSPDKNINLIAPNYLPESKKENRRLAVVVGGKNDRYIIIGEIIFCFISGSPKMVRLTCVMEGFEGNKTSKPKWTTNFEDHQISKDEDGTSWIDEGYAGWEVNVTVSNKDIGSKVRFPLINVVFYSL